MGNGANQGLYTFTNTKRKRSNLSLNRPPGRTISLCQSRIGISCYNIECSPYFSLQRDGPQCKMYQGRCYQWSIYAGRGHERGVETRHSDKEPPIIRIIIPISIARLNVGISLNIQTLREKTITCKMMKPQIMSTN